jgi:Ca-activated chloride channel homolog
MRLRHGLISLLLCVSFFACAQETEQTQDQAGTFRVKVNLVNVYATVTDEAGAPVTDLKKEDFRIAEDGHPEKVAIFEQESDRPLSIVLAIDTSQSVGKDLKLELDSARRFVSSTVRPVDRLALYHFSEVVKETVPFTNSFQKIADGIRRTRVGAGTAMFDAIYLAGMALNEREGRKVLVLITDGGDTTSSIDYQTAVRTAQQSEALVYSIIMVPIENDAGRNTGGEHALIQLAKDTGGKYYYASTPTGLDTAFQQISKELRTQYLLAYYPSRRTADSGFRRVQITVNNSANPEKKLTVRHRAGYYTSKLE